MAASTADLIVGRDSLLQHFQVLRIQRDASPQTYANFTTTLATVQTNINAVQPLETAYLQLRAIANPSAAQITQTQAAWTAFVQAQQTASASLTSLSTLLTNAWAEIRTYVQQNIDATTSIALPAGTTAASLAQQLPAYQPNRRAYGALVVAGRLFYLTTDNQARSDGPVASITFQRRAVSGTLPNSRLGFPPLKYNHIEMSAAGLMLRLLLAGYNVSGAYVVVNQPSICNPPDSCTNTLPQVLPVGQSLKVYTISAQQVGGQNVLNPLYPNGQDFTGV
jgi:hypothetical protein